MRKSVKRFPLFYSHTSYKCRTFGLYVFLGIHTAETLELVKGDVDVYFDIVVPADTDGLVKLRYDQSFAAKELLLTGWYT